MRSYHLFDFLDLSILLAVGIWGCTSIPQPAEQRPVSKGWEWNDLIAAKLTPAMKAAPLGDLCPSGKVVEAEQFWQALVYSTVKAESGFDPKQDYTEKFPDSKGSRQVSSGLLQLSLDDRAKGGDCAGLSAANIHEPAVNLSCGVRIMDYLVGSRASLRASLGRYWSTIRDRKVDAQMKILMPICF